MFDRLFQRPQTLARHRAGPLLQERLRYLGHLAGQGMAHSTLCQAVSYLLIVTESLQLAARAGDVIPLSEIQLQATRWADEQHPSPTSKGRRDARQRFLWHASQFLRFLGRLQLPPSPPRPYAATIAAFADYLSRDQGQSEQTVQTRCQVVEPFLERLGAANCCLAEITLSQIDVALMQYLSDRGCCRRTVAKIASSLRAFFRYAQSRGWCRAGLATGIKAPRLFPLESLPRGPSWDAVQQLLASTDTERVTDIRDRALLLLLAVYGLRAGEVIRLRLEDFDWQREVLRVIRSKSQRVHTYPLSRPVGDAVLRYLQRGRPRSSLREVFLCRRAPFRPLTRPTLSRIVNKRLHTLGVVLPHYGPHALRHACASHLLSQGLSLNEIGDHLGHHHPDATGIYAKVDLAGLRSVADFDLGGLS
jgi:site-specific recombinase XerD